MANPSSNPIPPGAEDPSASGRDGDIAPDSGRRRADDSLRRRGDEVGERRAGDDRRHYGRRATDASPSSDKRLAEGDIVITGICGRLGRRLARELHRDRQVVGLDKRPFHGRPKDIEHFEVDLQRRQAQDVFRHREIAAVVHMGVRHNPRDPRSDTHMWNIAGFQKVLEWVKKYDIPKLIVLSSGNVYGPRSDNAQFLTEDAPLLGGTSTELGDLVELDMLAQSFFWKHPATESVILRPAHILGTVRNAPSNYLRLKVVPTLMGFDPVMQVVHQDDVVRAIRLALSPGARGVYNLGGPTPVPLSKALKMLGRSTIPLPSGLARKTFERMWRLHLSSFPPPELDFIRDVCMVDDSRAHAELRYRPEFSIEETLRAVDEERWV